MSSFLTYLGWGLYAVSIIVVPLGNYPLTFNNKEVTGWWRRLIYVIFMFPLAGFTFWAIGFLLWWIGKVMITPVTEIVSLVW